MNRLHNKNLPKKLASFIGVASIGTFLSLPASAAIVFSPSNFNLQTGQLLAQDTQRGNTTTTDMSDTESGNTSTPGGSVNNDNMRTGDTSTPGTGTNGTNNNNMRTGDTSTPRTGTPQSMPGKPSSGTSGTQMNNMGTGTETTTPRSTPGSSMGTPRGDMMDNTQTDTNTPSGGMSESSQEPVRGMW